jgi:hypothetical protein
VINEFLKRTADRNGFSRDRYEEKRIPTDMDNLVVMPFFGDIRGTFLLSSWLLHRYRSLFKPSKYFILASWPGYQSLFPYVDEYWSMSDDPQIKRFYEQADGFRNKSDLAVIYQRNLNEFFRDVVDWRQVVQPYYAGGITQKFWDEYKTLSRFLPHVASSVILGKEFNKELATRAGYKIFISPLQLAETWQMGMVKHVTIKKEFWIELVKRMLKEGMVPVIWQNSLTYDMSSEFTSQCLYVSEKDVGRVLSAMRAVGCVFDAFGGLSRLALAARCPYLALDERARYANLKEHEVDDLCCKILPKQYIFTFSTIISDGSVHDWANDLFNIIINRLNTFLPTLNRDTWPSTGESTEVALYENVRKNQNKKIGVRLLKVTRD